VLIDRGIGFAGRSLARNRKMRIIEYGVAETFALGNAQILEPGSLEGAREGDDAGRRTTAFALGLSPLGAPAKSADASSGAVPLKAKCA